jgi:FkbM family methyltransferase
MYQHVKARLFALVKARCISLSQAGQDFWVYAEAFNEMQNGYFVDVGANDGLTLSNTYLLERRYNWSGILVEANPQLCHEIAIHRQAKCVNVCVDEREGNVSFVMDGLFGSIMSDEKADSQGRANVVEVPSSSLANILRTNDAPHIIDYLSIDIEGAEDKALLGFPFSEYIFRCLTIERPSHELHERLVKNRYQLIKRIPELDNFYIHADFSAEYTRNLGRFWKKKWVKIGIK